KVFNLSQQARIGRLFLVKESLDRIPEVLVGIKVPSQLLSDLTGADNQDIANPVPLGHSASDPAPRPESPSCQRRNVQQCADDYDQAGDLDLGKVDEGSKQESGQDDSPLRRKEFSQLRTGASDRVETLVFTKDHGQESVNQQETQVIGRKRQPVEPVRDFINGARPPIGQKAHHKDYAGIDRDKEQVDQDVARSGQLTIRDRPIGNGSPHFAQCAHSPSSRVLKYGSTRLRPS